MMPLGLLLSKLPDAKPSGNGWLDKNALLAFLPSSLVDRILQDATHYNFTGDPVVPVDELSDRIALAQRDFDIKEANR